jgi:hypothetical protein
MMIKWQWIEGHQDGDQVFFAQLSSLAQQDIVNANSTAKILLNSSCGEAGFQPSSQ